MLVFLAHWQETISNGYSCFQKQLVPLQSLDFNQYDYWILVEPCAAAGQYLDQSTGCQNCPADHWSAAGNTAATCTACPSGKGVASGSGTQASDCSWSKLI